MRDDKFFSGLYSMLAKEAKIGDGRKRGAGGGSLAPRGPRAKAEPGDGELELGSEASAEDSGAEMQSDHETERLVNRITGQIGAA